MPSETVRAPWPVLVAVGVVALQAAALLGFSAWLGLQRLTDTPSNERVFEGSAVYLLASGLLVGLIAAGLRARRGWAYGAAVVVQLIVLGVTYEMVEAGFWLGAAPAGLAAAAVLGTLLQQSSRAAFGRDDR
ncbi:MAG: hypothetical protein ACOC96_02405 [Actinomycetota bacterium]